MAWPYHHFSTPRRTRSAELHLAAQLLAVLEVTLHLFVFDFHMVAAARAFLWLLTGEEMAEKVVPELESSKGSHWFVESDSGAVRLCHSSLFLSLVEPVAGVEALQFRSVQEHISVFA